MLYLGAQSEFDIPPLCEKSSPKGWKKKKIIEIKKWKLKIFHPYVKNQVQRGGKREELLKSKNRN